MLNKIHLLNIFIIIMHTESCIVLFMRVLPLVYYHPYKPYTINDDNGLLKIRVQILRFYTALSKG